MAVSSVGALLAILLATGPGSYLVSAQGQRPNPSSPGASAGPATVLKVTTRLVIVNVVATDHKGLPVTDLRQDEFKVMEEGKQENVRVFSLQNPRVSQGGQPPAAGLSGASLPPNVVTNVRHLRTSGPLNVLLLDGLNTRMNNQQYVKAQLLEFLKKLPADQTLAVYLLGTRLQLLQDFTSDPAVLKNVIEHLKDLHSPLLENAVGGPVRFWLEGMPLPPQLKRQVLEFQQETESDDTDKRVAITVSALRSLAHALAGYPGRKNLIWVSESVPIDILPNKVRFGESAVRASRSYAQIIATTANFLTDAQIAVYPVDARALVNSDVFNPAVRYDTRGDPVGSGAEMGRAMDDMSDELMAARSAMQEIAEYTGGRAFYNRNDIGNVVRQSIDDGSTYYTLGYYPENKSWDGRFRKISVKVTRPGVQLRYRLGYYALNQEDSAQESPQRREAEFSLSLSPEAAISTALRFMAGILPPSPKTGLKTVVTFAIDAQALSFSGASDGKKRARVECAVRVFTAKEPGKPLKTEAENIDADLPPESYAKILQTGLPCRIAFDLPAGEYLLRLGVLDAHTGLIGTANAELAIPGESGGKQKAGQP
ncbi:MAG TPA: VWA domain-containing protein [Candidatus Angelobacter sp.]|nr:VWA domain-containing protein [Candidatus Angelobacter sp.]